MKDFMPFFSFIRKLVLINGKSVEIMLVEISVPTVHVYSTVLLLIQYILH